ncbi:hypothetical protein CDD81_8104 [Ophiocordyceps australis]|uniref:E3 ubiquitin-protein ligase listerin n=1 Tax=Ophiocordyceps australis TaxID=1399860 RepID=A0A2C5Y2J9_9HYPO|nr:hypothetical protein CDD81_8104 [Ophiocordyceps australis]
MDRAQSGKGAASRLAVGAAAFGSASSSPLSYLTEPPSLNAVSDPHVVVSLKNLNKKDSITKTKALEDLLQHVQTHAQDEVASVDEALLDVWAQLYPRTSIDNSRRVRELSHTLQFELVKTARKRMERHIPKIVGAWLAGLYDRDRVVARAARNGLSSLLSSPEKMSAFWVKCRSQILDFATQAVQETQDTLSDERSTTFEDAEAKYFRVIAASLSLVLGLLNRDEESVKLARDKFDAFFAEDVVWKSVTFKDSHVRRAASQLLVACLGRHLPYAETSHARQAFITGGLKTNQTGSVRDYLDALISLTTHKPDIWTTSSNDKKSSFNRLQAFIARGPQGDPPAFWQGLSQLLSCLPTDLLTLESSSSLLKSLQTGATSRDQTRSDAPSAWKCYTSTVRRCLAALPAQDHLSLAKDRLFPLIQQLLFPITDSLELQPQDTIAQSVIADIHLALMQSSPHISEALCDEWTRMGTLFCTNISASFPEVSEKLQDLQTKIGKQGHHWFGVVGNLHCKLQDVASSMTDPSLEPSIKVVEHSISLLKSCNLKPFGAAQVLEYAMDTSPHLFIGKSRKTVVNFLLGVAQDPEGLFQSPSWEPLLSCVVNMSVISELADDNEAICDAWIEGALALPPSLRNKALVDLVSKPRIAFIAQQSSGVQELLLAEFQVANTSTETDEQASAKELLMTAILHKALHMTSRHQLSALLVKLLGSQPENTDVILELLEALIRTHAELFSLKDSLRTDLLAQLLATSEIAEDATSAKAASIRSILDGEQQDLSSVVGILRSNLEQATSQSLEIGTMVDLAMNATETGASWEQIFPNTDIWTSQLLHFMERPINPSLSITSRIGGVILLAKSGSDTQSFRNLPRDRKGRSIATRMALYTSQLLNEALQDINVSQQRHAQLLYLIGISCRLASNQIMCSDDDGLWTSLDQDTAMSEAQELIESYNRLLYTLIQSASRPLTDEDKKAFGVLHEVAKVMMKEASQLTVGGAHSAEALAGLLEALAETSCAHQLESLLVQQEVLKTKPNTILAAAGLVAGFGERLSASKDISNFCNRLVSDTAAAVPGQENTLATLDLLTLCAQVYHSKRCPVANNRVVFAVKQITSWMDSADKLDANLRASMCRTLTQLLPWMKDVYGSYWEMTLDFCASLWQGAGSLALAESLPIIHASLKLLITLETVEEPNDDLQDALKEFDAEKSKRLMELLKLPRNKVSQPLKMVDSMLCREIDKIRVSRIPEPEELFPLVGSKSHEVQTAAFSMLHKKIAEQQQQESVNVLLDKREARLPGELISLLLEAPTLDKFSDEDLALFPCSVRCYLLAWKLLFDAFDASSFKVRSDFTEQIKEQGYMTPLLDFLFDVLGHSAAHPLNLDKEKLGPQQIRHWDVDMAEAETAEQGMHWLLVHVFYLVVKFTPGLFKAWFMNCRSKQTRIAVEAWTQKYFSPLIIADTLDDVEQWADSQEQSEGEQPLQIKVLRTAREVTAGYEVDELQATIAIALPPTYPLEGVSVTGVRRVAVSERKWQSWVLATQGVIAFSGGSIIDGLLAFRRNVAGAMRGQGECAICYSIISADRRMPDKRCTTCKNSFHRSCLYKWFTTSSQNTCPLCRNPIDYLGADTVKRRHGAPEM